MAKTVFQLQYGNKASHFSPLTCIRFKDCYCLQLC